MPKKRLTTNGNVFRRTDGRWQSVIWYFDEQGVKRRKVFSSKTKTEAQQKITNYIAQFNAEVRNSDESQKTLKDSLTRWLQVFKFPSVERTTYDRLECTAQHQVFPLIGDKIVGDITAADLKSVLNHWMERGYAYTTVKKVHILLNEYFRYLMSTEQTPVFFAAPKYPAMLSKLAKGRTESYGDSARGPTWQSHEQRFPAALQ